MSSNSIRNDIKQLKSLLTQAASLAQYISAHAESYQDYYQYTTANEGFGTWTNSSNPTSAIPWDSSAKPIVNNLVMKLYGDIQDLNAIVFTNT